MNFRHFIITRFNTNIYPIDFPPRLEDGWLAPRLDLFRRFCFPTLEAQENKNFEWLVLFDEKTSEKYHPLIEAFSRFSNFTPLFCGPYETVMPTVRSHMRQVAPDADWFLTTRLDNDDALSVHFVKVLHGLVGAMKESDLAPKDTLYINFPNGLQIFDGDFYNFRDVTNAFVSLLERSGDNPHTVFWVDHPAIYDVSPVIQAETKPLWLQNVHDTNVYNYVRGDKVEEPDVIGYFPCHFDE